MAGMSSPGIASGFDFESIIVASVDARRAKYASQTTKRKEETNIELEGVNKLQDALKTFGNSLTSLSTNNSFNARKAVSNQPTENPYFTIDTKADASNGDFDITVKQLASTEKVEKTFGKDTEFGKGKLTITIPGVADPNDPKKPVEDRSFSIDVNEGDNLAQIRKKINSTNDLGVNASIIVDEQGNQKLTIDSGVTGASNGSNISLKFEAASDSQWTTTLSPDEINSLSDENKASYNNWVNSNSLNYTNGQGNNWNVHNGTDAKITVNGSDLKSKTNTFDNQIAGLSLTVQRESSKDDNGNYISNHVSVEQDVDGITKKVSDFVDSYNTLMDTMNGLYKHNTYSDGKNMRDGGALAGDSQLKSIQNSLRNIMTSFTQKSNDAGIDIYSLGLEVDKNGHFSLDTTKFKEGVETNFNAVVNLFTAGSDEVKAGQDAPEDAGLIVKLDSLVKGYTKSNGLLDQRSDDLNNKIRRFEDKEAKNTVSLERYEEDLRRKYSILDMTIQNYNNSFAYLQSVMI